MYYELTPAYGRDYKNKTEVISSFTSGKDFSGDYKIGFNLCSVRDFHVGDIIMLRYNKNRSVTPYKITEKDVTVTNREE